MDPTKDLLAECNGFFARNNLVFLRTDIPGYPFGVFYCNDGEFLPVIGMVVREMGNSDLQVKVPIAIPHPDPIQGCAVLLLLKFDLLLSGNQPLALEFDEALKSKLSKAGIPIPIPDPQWMLDQAQRIREFDGDDEPFS